MNIINSGVCKNLKNMVLVREAFISDTLNVDRIFPIKSGGTIEIAGYRPTGIPDTISVNFQFNANNFGVVSELFVFVAEVACTVISVKEMHIVPSTVASSISLVKRSGVVNSTVVSSMDLGGSSNTVQNGSIIGANAVLAVGDSLRIDELISVAGVSGAILSIVLEI